MVSEICNIHPSEIEILIYSSTLLLISIVEPHNALLNEHFCMELELLFDNEAMFEICKEKLKLDKPTFNSINHLVCQTISCITANLRFQSVLNCDLNALKMNLSPYPRIHFPIANIAPIISPDLVVHSKLSITDITNSVFDSSSNLISLESYMGKYMSYSMFYRGAVSPHQVSYALQSIKSRQTVRFVNWCPTGFKISISYQSAVNTPRTQIAAMKSSVAMPTNNSTVSYAWDRLNSKFKHFYAKKAFMHWFLDEGHEEEEFDEAEMNINSLIRAYLETLWEESVPVSEYILNIYFKIRLPFRLSFLIIPDKNMHFLCIVNLKEIINQNFISNIKFTFSNSSSIFYSNRHLELLSNTTRKVCFICSHPMIPQFFRCYDFYDLSISLTIHPDDTKIFINMNAMNVSCEVYPDQIIRQNLITNIRFLFNNWTSTNIHQRLVTIPLTMEHCFVLINTSNIRGMTKKLLRFLYRCEPDVKTDCCSNLVLVPEKYTLNRTWYDVLLSLVALISQTSAVHYNAVLRLYSAFLHDM